MGEQSALGDLTGGDVGDPEKDDPLPLWSALRCDEVLLALSNGG